MEVSCQVCHVNITELKTSLRIHRAGINAMPQYRRYFGFSLTKGTASTGIVYAIYTIGNIVGSFFAGPACDMYGRRYGMLFGATFVIIGTIVQATCHDIGAFMGGRFLLGFGVATSASAGPAYVSEMAHPAYRGPMVSTSAGTIRKS